MCEQFGLRWRFIFVGAYAATSCASAPIAVEAERLIARGDYRRAEVGVTAALAKDPSSERLQAASMKLSVATDRVGLAFERCGTPCAGERLHTLAASIVWFGLRYPSPAVRLRALHVCRAVNLVELADEMRVRLRDPDPRVRTWAAVALSDTLAGASVLADQLGGANTTARAIAMTQLLRLRGDEALPEIASIRSDPEVAIRAALARGLSFSQGTSAIAPLLRLLRDAAPTVRLAAARALEKKTHEESVRHALLRSTSDDDMAVRLAAIDSLASVVADAVVATRLRGLAENSEQVIVALHAGLALEGTGDSQPLLNAVARGLVSRRAAVRRAAVHHAARSRDRVALQIVKKALADVDLGVRLSAVRARMAWATPQSNERRVAVAAFKSACQKDLAERTAKEAHLCLVASDMNEGQAAEAELEGYVARASAISWRIEALQALLRRPSVASKAARDGLRNGQYPVRLVAAEWLLRRL